MNKVKDRAKPIVLLKANRSTQLSCVPDSSFLQRTEISKVENTLITQTRPGRNLTEAPELNLTGNDHHQTNFATQQGSYQTRLRSSYNIFLKAIMS